MNSETKWRDLTDDYTDTTYALVGFANFYWYDDETGSGRDSVRVMQGRRMTPNSASHDSPQDAENTVTPDLVIYVREGEGVVADAKKFPLNTDFWHSEFEQLKKYDGDLLGWPCAAGQGVKHDIVLLTHLSHSAAVVQYYRDKPELNYERPFVIVEFSRFRQRDEYFFFRRQEGQVSDSAVAAKLQTGVSVPMHVFIREYSAVKFYDADPPMPYLLQVLWDQIVAPAAQDKTPLSKVRRRQKVEVLLEVDDIVVRLRDDFSFKAVYGYDDDRQPKIPRREWVKEACEKLVSHRIAEWADLEKKQIKVYYKLLADPLSAFIELCGKAPSARQMDLFESTDE